MVIGDKLWEKLTLREHKGILELMQLYSVLIIVVVTRLYVFIKLIELYMRRGRLDFLYNILQFFSKKEKKVKYYMYYI